MHAHDVVTGALVGVAATTVAFVVTTVMQGTDRASRILASSQFIFAATLLLYAGWTQASGPGRVLVDLVAGAGLLLAVALSWSGVRAFHDKPPWLPAALLAPVSTVAVAAVVRLLETPAGIVVIIAGLLVAVFSAASVYELQTGSWAPYPPARVLQVFLAALVLAAVALAAFGWDDSHAVSWAAVGLVPTQIAIATCFLVLQREKRRTWGHAVAEVSNPLSDLDVLTPASFRFAAQGRLRRLNLVAGHACLVLVSVEDLRALNSAFGRSIGDEAVRKLAETIRAHVPPWAPIGHLGAGNFAVVAPAASPQTGYDIITSIEDALLTSRATTVSGIRIGAIYGIADTFTTTADYASLLEEAISSMASSAAKLKSTLLEQRLGKS